jgi:hypothetical protein
MIHGSLPRAAHRAAPEGGLALLVKQSRATESSPGGQHRQPAAQRRTPREPQRTMQLLMSGLGAMIMLAICGLSGFFVIAEERRGHAEAAGRTTPDIGKISTRAADGTPLSLDEVFPSREIRLIEGAAPYAIGMRHIDTDCNIAATGELGRLLERHGCSQVIRASMVAPYGGYQVTAGVFNLVDQAAAAQAGEQARQLVEGGYGTFAAMAADGPGTDPQDQPVAQVNWHEVGHYLVYCVIARPDGQIVRDDDEYAQRITLDLIESYLNGQILKQRESRA